MDSILTSIKKLLGITEEDTNFDVDIIIHINSIFAVLNQLGVGPSECFSISGKFETWNDFISDSNKLEAVKTYVYLRVRLIFDPPQSSAMIEATKETVKELEWRLNVTAESTT